LGTETVRVFAWKARWLTIRLTNCLGRSTFDFSKELDRIAPRLPLLAAAMIGAPDSIDSIR